jgi:threonine synthase
MSEPADPQAPAAPDGTLALESGLSLHDPASPGQPNLLEILEEPQKVAADSHQALARRLGAYADIIDRDVGDTMLVRARNLEREIGLRQLYLKFEGDNPSGTQKDRIAFAQAMDALRRGYDAITVATCGNYGAALATAAALAGLRCVVFIPRAYHTRRLEEIRTPGAEIVPVDGDYEQAVDASRERAAADEVYDANPGGANTALHLQAYGAIADEIYDELRDAPAAIAVPVSNGTTLAGIYRGFLSLYRRGRTSRMPRMIAGSAHRKNPIIQAFLKNLPRCEDLDPRSIRETPVNEPLINWHSFDGDHALDAVRATSGWAGDASDRDMLAQARLIRELQGLSVLPASASSLVVLLDRHKREPLPGDRYVVVLTGRKA